MDENLSPEPAAYNSAANKVFNIPELAENIQRHLSPLTLLRSQQINQTFRNNLWTFPTLKRALWLSSDIVAAQSLGDNIVQVNPLLHVAAAKLLGDNIVQVNPLLLRRKTAKSHLLPFEGIKPTELPEDGKALWPLQIDIWCSPESLDVVKGSWSDMLIARAGDDGDFTCHVFHYSEDQGGLGGLLKFDMTALPGATVGEVVEVIRRLVANVEKVQQQQCYGQG